MQFSSSNFLLTLCTVQLILVTRRNKRKAETLKTNAHEDACRNQAEYTKVKNEFTKKRNEIDGAFPWTVVILQNQKPICLGTLLAKPNSTSVNETSLVLTASGCITRQKGVQNKKHLKSLKVQLGAQEHNGKRSDIMRSIAEVKSLIINDDIEGVGVIKMKKPFNGDVKSICLPDFGSTPKKLNKCFLSALGSPTTYIIYKIKACEKDENATEKNNIEMCYLIKEKPPLLTYGSTVVCTENGLPFAFGITRKSKVEEPLTGRQERRVDVSIISTLDTLYSLSTSKERPPSKVVKKTEESFTAEAEKKPTITNTTKVPFKAKEFNITVVYKRPIIIPSFNWSLPN
ncbi:hypothetical protein D918_08033 [Trichuris suis]|nr:hypothetical protein D918_08033 [Trichuris suis]